VPKLKPELVITQDVGTALKARAEAQGGLLTTADLAGTSSSRSDVDAMLRAGALRRVCHGVFALPVAASGAAMAEVRFRELVHAAVLLRAREAHTITPAGPASIALHDLPLFGRPPTHVHVAAPHHGGRKTRGLVRPLGTHPAAELTVLAGLTVAAPARAVLDTARVMSTTAGVVAADAALRRWIVARQGLADVLPTLAGHLGVVHARKVLELASAGSESPGESWSAVVLDELGLPSPERQEPFEDADGFIGRSDFWWPGSRTVGEFDGRVRYGRANPLGAPARRRAVGGEAEGGPPPRDRRPSRSLDGRGSAVPGCPESPAPVGVGEMTMQNAYLGPGRRPPK
jgi:hypothetical protein